MHHKPFGDRAYCSSHTIAGLRGGPPERGEGREEGAWCREELGGKCWQKEKGGEWGWIR